MVPGQLVKSVSTVDGIPVYQGKILLKREFGAPEGANRALYAVRVDRELGEEIPPRLENPWGHEIEPDNDRADDEMDARGEEAAEHRRAKSKSRGRRRYPIIG